MGDFAGIVHKDARLSLVNPTVQGGTREEEK